MTGHLIPVLENTLMIFILTIAKLPHIFLLTLLADLIYTYLLYPCTLPKSRGKLIIQSILTQSIFSIP